jgi:hypothetical protein
MLLGGELSEGDTVTVALEKGRLTMAVSAEASGNGKKAKGKSEQT